MEAKLRYYTLEMTIKFEKPVVFTTYPAFYFRSLLGKELFNMICIFRKKTCEVCSLKYRCAYSFIFESPITRDNPVLYGRNFASHPFVIETDTNAHQSVESLKIKLHLIGQATEYVPIVVWSFVRAGEQGIFKSKVRYELDALKIDGISSFSKGKLILPDTVQKWRLDSGSNGQWGKVFIEVLSPLRFKKNGKFVRQLKMDFVAQAAVRRMEILLATYGEQEFKRISFPEFEVEEETQQLQWIDLPRWSARQKQLMRLGGVVGYLTAKGKFSKKMISLLKAAELFHIGKNTSFGLGKIKFTFVEGDADA